MLDPLTTVLDALGTGALHQDGHIQAIYMSLNDLVQEKMKGAAELDILSAYESDPVLLRVALRKALKKAGVDDDRKIIDTAQELLSEVRSTPGATASNLQTWGTVESYSQGKYHQVMMNFETAEGKSSNYNG
ncbi:MAG TPA: hypothetical protein VKV40_13280 [Ktedonobacteraceae bacterium]|nr:hypothetical protein [Ktedonobacteraceae bacterium]